MKNLKVILASMGTKMKCLKITPQKKSQKAH